MEYIASLEVGDNIVWHLDRPAKDGWSMWFDLESQQTRVWNSSSPSLDENGLILDNWDKSFKSGKAAWDYVKSLPQAQPEVTVDRQALYDFWRH